MNRSSVSLLVFLSITLVLPAARQAWAEPASPQAAGSSATVDQSLWKRSRLTGDWGGARSWLETRGVKLDLELTMFYQGLESGTGSQDYEFGSRLDGFVKLDTGKMGLWKGGGLVSHLEYRSGDLPGSLGGTFFPTNSGMEFPSD